MSYAWKVDWHNTDLFDDEQLPVYGPWRITPEEQAILDAPGNFRHLPDMDAEGDAYPCKPRRFRLLDDDGEVYYRGVMTGDGYEDAVFGPLDDWGTPNAGCTEIQYWQNGKWVTV